MKYTKNIGNKLLLMGFFLNIEEKDTHRQIWTKGIVDVEVVHENKSTSVHVGGVANIKSIDQLKQLDKLINQ